MENKPEHDEDRRAFLKKAGKFAATVPPAMTILMTTTLSSTAIAASGSPTPIGPGTSGYDSGRG